MREAAGDEDIVSFSGGLPSSQTFPREELARIAADVLRHGTDEVLQYGWPEGLPALREVLARRLERRGLQVSADDVLITNGAQDAIGFVVDVLEAREVQTDALTYSTALDLFRHRECEPRTGAAALRYAMPAMHNPLGRPLDAAERAECLKSEWLIEDDAYADLLFDGEALPSLAVDAPERVFHIGTLSKTVAPGLRVGWLVAPKQFRERLRALKNDQDLHSTGLTQAIAAKLLEDGRSYDARLAQLRSFYATCADRLVHELEKVPDIRFTPPRGAFSIWVETGLPVDDETALRVAIRDFKVAWDAGRLFRTEPKENDTLSFRVNFSALPAARFAEGISRLTKVLGTLARGSAQKRSAVP
ncbi:MAG: PLP-dependent aminotransferase family protein [Archangium sp.]